jgi:hypothetical protein
MTVPTPGDANCDGAVTAADVPSLVAVLEGIAPPLCVGADADQNGVLDENDIVATINALFEESIAQ